MKWPAQRLHSQANKGFGMYEVAARLQGSGADVIHLEVGRPADDTPVHIKEAAKAALDAGIVHYGELQGTLSLRQALADRYRAQQDVAVTPAEILITNGVTQGAFATFMAAIDPGDEVIVLEPWYPQHNSKIELVGGTVVTVSMRRVDGAYRLDPKRLEAAITSRTRMIVLINPTNPTGTVYSASELAALAQICIRYDLLVLSDEVYEYITFDGHRHISIATLPGMRERTITVSAFTKAALTLRDPRHYLFFNRTPAGKRAATEYMARLKERTTDRDKRISLQARRAQLKAIRAAGLQAPHDLGKISQPVFVANGDNDVMVASSHSADLARRIPNAKLTIYPDSGHGGVFQYHREFVPAVLDFLG